MVFVRRQRGFDFSSRICGGGPCVDRPFEKNLKPKGSYTDMLSLFVMLVVYRNVTRFLLLSRDEILMCLRWRDLGKEYRIQASCFKLVSMPIQKEQLLEKFQ